MVSIVSTLTCTAALLVALPAGAQSITASVDRTTVAVGEHVTLTVEVEGRDAGGAVIDPPGARGLQLVSASPFFRGLASSNGRASLTMRWNYRALAAGSARIGGARVIVAGRTRTTDPIEITVTNRGPSNVPAAPQADAGRGELYVRAVARPERPFVGQQVVVDYILYFQGHLEPRSAQFVGAWQAEGLWREELDVPPSSRSPRPAGNGYWSVLVRRVALYPTRSGEVRLGALTFEIELLRRESDPFGFFGAYSSRFERASPTAPAVQLVARALPPGAPVGFGGAVGSFTVEASIDRSAGDVGEPLQLSAVVEGDGNLSTMAAPVVETPASFERYEPTEDRVLDRSRAPATGRKTFSWSMVPRSGGRFELDVQFAYFDPRAEQYRSLSTQTIDVEVVGAVDPVAAATDGPAPPMAAGSWTREAAGRPSALWLVAGGAVPLAVLAGLVVGVRVRRPRRRVGSPPVLAQASAALDDPRAFYQVLLPAIRGSMSAGGLTAEDAADAHLLIERANQALYAPGGGTTRVRREADLRWAEGLMGRARGRP